MERIGFNFLDVGARILLLSVCLHYVSCFNWQSDFQANKIWHFKDIPLKQQYKGSVTHLDYFKLLSTEDDHLLIGARSQLLNISMADLKESVWRLEWEASKSDRVVCTEMQRSQDECQNYIRVFGKGKDGEMLLCGTNAFRPRCRTYKKDLVKGTYDIMSENAAIGSCPFDPKHNSTYVFSDGKLISATVADTLGRDPLILKDGKIRTIQHDSRWLNDPHFVSSFEIEDKIYFFFRERALENINCGKAVFSRVGRVCKNDNGASTLMENLWTSFFKARLNCSIPGEFPFYFDEIQSTSEFGQGNYMSTHESSNRTKMFYAVFSTPHNSIPGSAVCAFTYKDIVNAFKGKFKGQKSFSHNWLPVPNEFVPEPHPAASCVNDSAKLTGNTLNFIKAHTLMDKAVQASGGAPVLIKLSLKARFTKIAIDFQVHATDRRYYDVMFVGTDDGRVLKAINKGQGIDGSSTIESVVIEDMQIFPNKEPVTDLKIYRDKMKGIERLIVMSRKNIVSIPLHRCEEQKTCRNLIFISKRDGGNRPAVFVFFRGKTWHISKRGGNDCVALQDPYCSWVGGVCAASDRGLQSILHGELEACGRRETTTVKASTAKTPSPSVVHTTTASPKCNCTCGASKPYDKNPSKNSNGQNDNSDPNMSQGTVRPQVFNAGRNNGRDANNVVAGAKFGLLPEDKEKTFTTAEYTITIVSVIVVTAIISFIAGYRVSMCRGNQSQDDAFISDKQEIYGSLQKNHQRHLSVNSDKSEPRYVNHTQLNYGDINNSQKHLNIVVNLSPKGSNLPNGNAPQKPITNLPISTENKTYV